MFQNEPLSPGQYYHIYNCGINGTPLFRINHDYEHFLLLYERFIDPVAETYAWCLMGNHFHMLVQIKENVFYKYNKPDGSVDDYQCIKPDRSGDAVRFEINDFEMRKWETIYIPNLSSSEGHDRLTNTKNIKIPKPYLHFSHLFNAYSKYFNKKYNRHGSLFERPFKRKLVDNVEYLKQLVLYIHNNPVHHGFCSHPVEYPWTSYLSMISLKPIKLKRDVVIGWFDGEANFKQMHEGKVEIEGIERWLKIG